MEETPLYEGDLDNRETNVGANGFFAQSIETEIDAISQRLCYEKGKATDVEEYRSKCRELEGKLGIDTQEERTLEASLFIDYPFMQVATLRGDEHPEELFGVEAWHGWLEARLALKRVDTLTLPYLSMVHEMLSEGFPSEIKGKIRETGEIAGDTAKIDTPIRFSRRQIDTVISNPLLNIMFMDGYPDQGYIVYPTAANEGILIDCLGTLSQDRRDKLESQEKISTKQLVTALLENAVERYNSSSDDPLSKACQLQRDVVSTHAYTDCNGRLSRLLMLWALEKEGETPSILRRPEEDHFFSDAEWKEEIKEGQNRFRKLVEKKTGSKYTSSAQFLHSHQELAYFDQIYNRSNKAPSRDVPMRHEDYRGYIEGFLESYSRFCSYAEAETYVNENYPIHMGGAYSHGLYSSMG